MTRLLGTGLEGAWPGAGGSWLVGVGKAADLKTEIRATGAFRLPVPWGDSRFGLGQVAVRCRFRLVFWELGLFGSSILALWSWG